MFSLKQVSDLTVDLKSLGPAVVVITTCIAGWVKECSDYNTLKADIAHLKSLNDINAKINNLTSLVTNLEPPTLQEVKDENLERNNAAIDSDSDTF